MQGSRFRRFLLIAIMVILAAFMAAVGYWFCQRNNAIAFLPIKTGAQWIINPAPPEIVPHPNTPVQNLFRQRFVLPTVPSNATLTLCAFKNATVSLNGHEIPNLHGDGKNWKSPMTAEVTAWLQSGTNDVVVQVINDSGPPALWLHLQANDFSLSSDAAWQVSLTGKTWAAAHPAGKPIPIPRWSPLFDDINMLTAIENQWRSLGLFFVITVGMFFFGRCQRRAGVIIQIKPSPISLLLLVILLARTLLFFNGVTKLPSWTGFDERGHLAYIQFIQQHGALPAPDGGTEMHQPPLYYLIAATLTKLGGAAAEKASGLMILRMVNMIFGLLNCWLALLCLRRLFPNNQPAQIVGLLLTAFLPSYLYLSWGLSNDPLTGLLITTAFYFLLRALPSQNFWFYAATGLALGAALLTKLSALPAVPIFLIAVGWQGMQYKEPIRQPLLRMGIITLLCLLVAGWHYLRIWSHTGTVALPHSSDSAWWQVPGFRTASYYLTFGQVLVSPLFSGLSSFADGMYSTFWGDGMISGATELIFRPPWNYDLMKAGYLLALPLTLLAIAGLVISLRRNIKAEWLFIIGMIFSYLLAVLGITLLGPWQSQVKAFYAIPAFLPMIAAITAGWHWLAGRSQTWRTMLWILVVFWSLTSFATFWINPRSAEYWRSRALVESRDQHFSAAVMSATEALKLNPNDFETHCLLASVYTSQKRPHDAVQQYLAALKINPDSPKILDMFALMQLDGGKEAGQQAVNLATRACELTRYQEAGYLTTLALAQANIGENPAAIEAAENAVALAKLHGDTDLQKQNRNLIERCQQSSQPK